MALGFGLCACSDVSIAVLMKGLMVVCWSGTIIPKRLKTGWQMGIKLQDVFSEP